VRQRLRALGVNRKRGMDAAVSNALAGVLPQVKLQAEKPQDAVFQPVAG